MSIQTYPYKYFSGANVQVTIDDEKLIECAGISFSVNESNQPAYGYASHLYDVVLPGRRIIQGTFVVNFHLEESQHELLLETIETSSFLEDRSLFDIKIDYGLASIKEGSPSRLYTNVTLRNCFLVSRGQSIQISENVILEEFGFIARNIEGEGPKLRSNRAANFSERVDAKRKSKQ
tara:strand:+ start:82 stop:612 length:531 start_codon:yes stop_codon:yes gene_type:complete